MVLAIKNRQGRKMEYLVMIQARCGSTRLPNKVMKNLCGKPQLQWVIERVQRSNKVDEVMVVTSIDKANLPILQLCAGLGVRVGVGSEEDVLDRFYQTARLLMPRYVVRVTGDCPCIDAGLVDDAISQMADDTDYCANTIVPTFADGLDFEVIKFSALERAWREADHAYEREHVTQYMIHHPELFRQVNITSPIGDFSGERWTVDGPEDFAVVEEIYAHFLYFEKKEVFGYMEILDFLNAHPQVRDLNKKYKRNEGLQQSIAAEGDQKTNG